MIRLFLLVSAIPVMLACGQSTKAFVHSDIKSYRLESIAIMPFMEDDKQKDEESLKSRKVEKGSGEKLTPIFYDVLKTRSDIKLISMEDVARAIKGIIDAEGELPQKSLAAKVGKELKADGVIIGRVDMFQERIGGPLGISRPASVGFEVELLSVQDGQLLWKSIFYETQAALSEDVGSLPLFIRRRGKWITAEELSRYGVEEVVKGFPYNER